MSGPFEREREAAIGAAVGALRRRERTVAETYRWLCERGVPEEVAGEAVAELIELGELDDDRFARGFASDKRELSGWGPERIEAALVDRGLERSLAESASAEEREEQLGRAVATLSERGFELTEGSERSRALSFLTRRGYEYELAYDAIRKAQRERPAAA